MAALMNWEEAVLDGMLTTRKTYADDDPKLDENQRHIIEHIKQQGNKLSFECVFEALTHLGLAPALVYDDNGYFAVSDCGVEVVRGTMGDAPVVGHDVVSFIEAADSPWRPTVREALNAYIDGL